MALRIIFMGTPQFAVPCLEILLKNNYHIVGVVTMPDKAAGRNMQLQFSDVKKYALEHNLPLLQPEKLKNPDFLAQLTDLKPDLGVVVAFRMLPEIVWNMPTLGTINLHASLLPDYRGAAPLNWAIMNGETQTGVSTFFLQHQIDTGEIILQETENISPDDNVGNLHDRLMLKGADLMLKTVQLIEKGTIKTFPQADKVGKIAPKIFKETCQMDFSKSAIQLHNFVRGLSPYPAAWTKLNGKICKIFKTQLVDEHTDAPIGTYISDKKTFLHFVTAKGLLAVEELQLEGRKKMQIADFLRGNPL